MPTNFSPKKCTQPGTDFGKALCWFFLLHLRPSLLFPSLPPSLHSDLLSFPPVFTVLPFCLCPSFVLTSFLSCVFVHFVYSLRKHIVHSHSSGIRPDIRHSSVCAHIPVPRHPLNLPGDASHTPAQTLCVSFCHVAGFSLPPCLAALRHGPQATADTPPSPTSHLRPCRASAQVHRVVCM